jgi:drug/metabolite transporter (DMT)-like permease
VRDAGRSRPDRSILGYGEVLAAAALWGSSGIFSVHLFRRGMSPESLALLRPLVGVVFLALLAGLTRRRALRVDRRGLLYLAGVGGGFTALFQVAYQIAIEGVGVPTTVALLYLAPALVVAVAGPVLGELPSPGRWALAGVSVVGVWMTALGAYGVDVALTVRGMAWGATAGAAFAGYTVFGRHAAPRYGSLATVLWSTVGACAMLAVVLPALGRVALPPDRESWILLLAFGLLTVAVAAFLFYDALGRIEAGRASITSTLEPVVAALLATWLLGQSLTPLGWVGLALVVTGVSGAYLLGRPPLPDVPPHE